MDEYDHAVQYLTENPEQIPRVWANPGYHPHGCLFRFAVSTNFTPKPGCLAGCLTQIRARDGIAETPELTEEIARDERLPLCAYDIKPEHLLVFAEWQRRLDKELGVRD